MKVTLAYPYTDGDGTTHDPDKTITVDDEIGRMLVHEGRARKADPGTRPSPKAKGAKTTASSADDTPTTPTSEEG